MSILRDTNPQNLQMLGGMVSNFFNIHFYNPSILYGNVYVNVMLRGEPIRQVVYPKWSIESYPVFYYKPPEIGKFCI